MRKVISYNTCWTLLSMYLSLWGQCFSLRLECKLLSLFYCVESVKASCRDTMSVESGPTDLDRIICLLCVYICHYIFSFYYLDIFFFFPFFLTHRDRKHYDIKVVESIQFVCTGNSGISRVLCNANNYQSIHEG